MEEIEYFLTLEGSPNNIKFIPKKFYLKTHKGNWKNPTKGKFKEEMILPNYLQEVYTIVANAKPLGFRELSSGTKLIGHVPHVAPEAYLHLIFPPLPQKEIDNMVYQLGKDISIPLECFYLINNGINLFSGSLFINGLRRNYNRQGDDVWQPFDLMELNTYFSPTDSRDSHLFIGGYQSDKSMLYIDLTNFKVYRCNHESINPLNEWASFEQMLLTEVGRLSKLFDKQGILIKGVKSTAPV